MRHEPADASDRRAGAENALSRLPPDALHRLQLIRSRRVGAVSYHRLLSETGSASAALQALPELARKAGEVDYNAFPRDLAEAELATGMGLGAWPLFHGMTDYPPALASLPDAPPLLWLQGQSALLTRPMLAVVGARNASSLGLRMARRLALTLGEAGFVVVSGLARGIDAAAHEAALPHGTIAVQAGGVDVNAPEENRALADQIRAQGLCLSEQPPGLSPIARHFPARNRIIAGLAQAVIVVEAAARSGSLITARLALDQGREVMAVPGHPFDARAAGCNQLIRDGACLIRGARDICEALGIAQLPSRATTPPADLAAADLPRPALRPSLRAARTGRSALGGKIPAARHAEIPEGPPQKPRSLANSAALHRQILERLSHTPTPEDQLMRELALPPSLLLAELLALELEGRLQRQPGGVLSRL